MNKKTTYFLINQLQVTVNHISFATLKNVGHTNLLVMNEQSLE